MSNNLLKRFKLFTDALSSGSGTAVWGAITGTLSEQTDLQNALDNKADQLQVDGLQNDVDSLITSVTTLEANNTGTNTGDETQSSIISKLALHSGTVNIDFGKDGVLSFTYQFDYSWE